MAQEACEAQARAAYQQRVVEIEMGSIAGSISQLELERGRASQQENLRRKQAGCKGSVASRSARAADTSLNAL
jgi:hypothetical protein